MNLRINEIFVLTKVPSFNVRATDGDYLVRFQQILKDPEGSLVSVIDGVGSEVIPTRLLDEYLDEKKDTVDIFEKEIVSIEGEQYVKWRYEISGIENEGSFYGKWEISTQITVEDVEEQKIEFELELARGITPAIVTDKGDHYLIIVEILKEDLEVLNITKPTEIEKKTNNGTNLYGKIT